MVNLTYSIRIHKHVSSECITVMERQCWWENERNVPLALFSTSVDEDSLSALAARMKVVEVVPRQHIEPGKPDFPRLRKNQALKDFVGPQSWVLFDQIGDKGEWLVKHPSEWSSDPSFLASKKIVDALPGVNDTAERGCRIAELYKVKMITER